MHRSRRVASVLAAGAVLVALIPNVAGATSNRTETGHDPRAAVPEDRYAMAGGCYALRSSDGGYVVRKDTGFAATGEHLKDAEPFHFQATDLGRYLLFGSLEDFLAASEGLASEVAFIGPVNEAAGGSSVVAAETPSEFADWKVTGNGERGFSFTLPATDQTLAIGADGALSLAGADGGTTFVLQRAEGCATFPEIEVNVDGPIVGGNNSFQEVRGFLDAHLHMMAFEFLGGRARCGRPWHPYGVTYALVDCPDHEPGGHGAVLEAVLSGGDPVTGHNTDGWPTFEGWPRYDSLTHEQIYYKWMERAWRGGLRMFVNLLVDNNQLCKLYPLKKNSCNEMDGVRLQAKRIRELERYIDAQSGGPGEGWFRIVTNPFEARQIINEGKLAVVLGIEVSVPLDCGLTLDTPRCDPAQIEAGLDEVYDLGVRQMELTNKFDNGLSGVTGDNGTTGVIVNQGNFLETGRYWRMETCGESDGHAHDHTQMNPSDGAGLPAEITGRDAMVGGVLSLFGSIGAAPLYPAGPHCNVLGLSDLGEQMIRGMVDRGMIFDPDHMSARARTEALDLIESLGHSGIVSSHGWADETIYPRIYEAGGVVTPYAGDSAGFVEMWKQHKTWADDRYYFGFGYGADTNGFGAQGGPRGADAPNPVTYPFTGFGGVSIDQQQSGTRTYDINTDGVAHYGLYPDWIEDLRRQAGDEIVEDMARGPEAYLQMWERSIGIAPDACRADIADLTPARVRENGMTPENVLRLLGQPTSRKGARFRYCLIDGRTATLRFTPDGRLEATTLVN